MTGTPGITATIVATAIVTVTRLGRRRGRRLPDAAARRRHRAWPARRDLQGQARKATTTITYRRARFSGDVAVSGVASLDIATSRLTGRITVAGALPGTLQPHATLWDPDKPNATVRGTLGGQRVALLAPAR